MGSLWLIGCGVLILFGCPAIFLVSWGGACATESLSTVERYPGSKREYLSHSSFLPYTYGFTEVVFYTSDEIGQVASYYAEHRHRNLHFTNVKIAQVRWNITSAEDGLNSIPVTLKPAGTYVHYDVDCRFFKADS